MIIETAWRQAIEAELQEQGLSRSDIARLLGVSPATVGDYLLSRRSPGPDLMERWAQALGLQPVVAFEKNVPVSA